LIGASGCGKTTLLLSILGMIQPDEGEIRVLGYEINKKSTSSINSRIGYMPQETALTDVMTVKETLFYFGNIYQMKPTFLKDRFKMLKILLDLPSDDLKISKCSGGEKRRISFAAAVIHEPVLLILDEPTAGLDIVLKEKIWNFIWNETRCNKLSVILATHYLTEANKTDFVGLMKDGIIQAQGPLSSILSSLDAENLEDAFLTLCSSNNGNIINFFHQEDKKNLVETGNYEITKKGFLSWQILQELMKKNFRMFYRNST
jgi:ABC-type multidrug transport system ATPase subunit